MVRKIKVTDVQEGTNEQEPQDQATPPATEPEPTTEPHENTTTTPLQTEAVAVFETTVEPTPQANAVAESADSTLAEPPTPVPKPKRPPRKKKEKEAAAPNPDPTPPPTEEAIPPTPEEEHPAEEIRIPPPKAKAKPRAKPKAQQVSTKQSFPTHDDEGQRLRPPPSVERPTRPETPEEFWNSTLKNMKEKKDRQYASLIQAAF